MLCFKRLKRKFIWKYIVCKLKGETRMKRIFTIAGGILVAVSAIAAVLYFLNKKGLLPIFGDKKTYVAYDFDDDDEALFEDETEEDEVEAEDAEE